MEDKSLIDAVTKCIKDKCDEKCPLYKVENDENCEFILLDNIMKSIGVIPEDYLEHLQNRG